MKLKILLLAACTCLFTACHSLAPGGVYVDKVAYNADLTIATSYEMIHSFVTWEYQNREVLSGNPKIKESADKFRLAAPAWFRSAVALRDAYSANPDSANSTALDNALNVLRAAVREATTMMASTQVPSIAQ